MGKVFLLAAGAAAVLGAQQAVDGKLVTPAWDYAFPTQKQTCVNATAATSSEHGANERWVFHAVPEGTPPASGWPVFLSLVTDTFGSLEEDAECGSRGGHGINTVLLACYPE